jgi:hypothetical protein
MSMLLPILLLAVASASDAAVTLSGTVVDADGKPLAGAMVVVADGPSAMFKRRTLPSPMIETPEVLASATANGDGRFTVELPRQAPEVGWRRSRLAVWTWHPDAALSVRLIDREWLAAGLPLSLTLGRVQPFRLKVMANWRPAAQARIAPQRVAGQAVPTQLAERLTAITDAKGAVTLSSLAAADLDAVRVESHAGGIQWAGLPRLKPDEAAIVSLAPVGRLFGRLTADEPTAVRHRKLRFTTWQVPGDESAGGGVAEVVTDEEGRFDVPAVAAGSLSFELVEDGLPSLRFYVFCRCFSFKMLGQLYRRSPR